MPFFDFSLNREEPCLFNVAVFQFKVQEYPIDQLHLTVDESIDLLSNLYFNPPERITNPTGEIFFFFLTFFFFTPFFFGIFAFRFPCLRLQTKSVSQSTPMRLKPPEQKRQVMQSSSILGGGSSRSQLSSQKANAAA